MNKQEWKEELKRTRRNRQGLGLFVLDSFDDKVAELLEKYNKEIKEQTVCEMADAIKENLPNGQCWSDDEVDDIAKEVLSRVDENDMEY